MTLKILDEKDQELLQQLLDERILKKYAVDKIKPEGLVGIQDSVTEMRKKSPKKKMYITTVPPVWKELLFLLLKIAAIMIAFTLIFTFLYGMIRYSEPSMAPMIKDGDLVIYYRYTKSGYLPQDAVVLEFKGQRQVRRVVAVAGDTVDITEQGFMVNGSLQQEPDIYQKTERYEDGIEFPLTVPDGYVFVLGDSRENSTDSRVYGCVKVEDTLGKVMAVIRRRSI